jgi:hypothetical protein
MSIPSLSIIIPSYRKVEVIKEAIEAIVEEMHLLDIKFELIVVIDGDIDGTSNILDSLTLKELSFSVSQKNYGKGHAVKQGVSRASNFKYCALLDADLDLSPHSLRNAIEILEREENVGLVLGSKFHPDSIVNYSYFRGFQSKAYSLMVKRLFSLGVSETQTGMKVGRMALMKPILMEMNTNGFAFDLELLLGLKGVHCTFREIPVVLNQGQNSTVNIFSIYATIRETLSIFRSHKFNRKQETKCQR